MRENKIKKVRFFNLDLLYMLEGIRNPLLDAFFSAITYLGDEAAFIVMVLILFWCVDKTTGYYLSAVGFCGAVSNLALKMTFRVPRPWVLDPAFTIVESAREAATGYSFPSGHTQNAVGIYGALALTRKQTWAKLLCLCAIVFVPISRMYLGVHTPADVGVSFVLAIVLALILYPLYRRADRGLCELIVLLTPALALGIACLVYFALADFPAEAADHLAHASENVWKMTGAAAAMLLTGIVDRCWLQFETRAPWYAQILKTVLGLALVMGLKAGLKVVFASFLPQTLADFVRYFLTVAAAGIFWPMTFKFWRKKQERSSRT